MYQHNTVVSAFILVNDEATNAALADAKAQIGEAPWKQGYTEHKAKIARAVFKERKAPYRFKMEGTLLAVSTKELVDGSGNVYRKVRIELCQDDGKSEILSLDVGTEFCERLLPKLGTAVRTVMGKKVIITAFPTQDERGGRVFWNHAASIKADGIEVKASANHFALATKQAKAAVEALKAARIRDPKALKAAQKSSKEEYFWELAQKIADYCQQKAAAA